MSTIKIISKTRANIDSKLLGNSEEIAWERIFNASFLPHCPFCHGELIPERASFDKTYSPAFSVGLAYPAMEIISNDLKCLIAYYCVPCGIRIHCLTINPKIEVENSSLIIDNLILLDTEEIS